MVECQSQVLWWNVKQINWKLRQKGHPGSESEFVFCFFVFDSDSEVCTKKDSEAKPVLQGRNSL